MDQAIYAIEPDATPDIRGFFHGPRWNAIRTSYSFAEDYSGGLDKFAPDARVRAKFEDTAAWFPSLKTGPDGRVSTTVTLPDNLTTWVASVHAATPDTRVGSAQATVIATKDLLVRLETPRFLVAGDQPVLSAIAHNYLEQPQQIKLDLNLDRIKTAAPPTQLLAVGPGQAGRATWTVEAPTAGLAGATVSVKSALAADAMHLDFPVLPLGTPEFKAFAGSVDGAKPGTATFEVPEDALPGTTTVRLDLHSSPLSAILSAVDFLRNYPYGCVEQTMSRFLPDVAVKTRLDAAGVSYGSQFEGREKRIREGMRRLKGFQHADGGWGWWSNDETQVEMTAYVLYGLAEARAGNFPTDSTVVGKAIGQLKRNLPRIGQDVYTRSNVRRDAGADARAFALLALAKWNAAPPVEVNRLWNDRNGLSNFGLAQTALALATLGDERKYAALELLRGRVSRTESGQLFWNANARAMSWQDNTTETTSYTLQALLLIAPDDPMCVDAVRWLESRNARGYWDSTKDSGAAAIALAEYIRVRRPAALESLQTVITLNGVPVDIGSDGAIPADRIKSGKNELQITSNGILDFSGGVSYLARAQKAAATSSEGINVAREYFVLPKEIYAKAKGHGTWGEFYDDRVVSKLSHVTDTVKSGERVLVKVTLTSQRPLRYVALEDPLPAGCEILEDQPENWTYAWDFQEYRDDRAAFFFRSVSPGRASVYYVMRPTTPGHFNVLPTSAWAMYAPDIRARGPLNTLTISESF